MKAITGNGIRPRWKCGQGQIWDICLFRYCANMAARRNDIGCDSKMFLFFLFFCNGPDSDEKINGGTFFINL